jgi:hypothetical protein
MAASRPSDSLPLVLRIPPWQTALLFLITAVCAAVNLYSSPSFLIRGFTITIGLLAFGAAIASLRLYLVVDEEGIGVRSLLHEASVDWPDISEIEVVHSTYNRLGLRVVRSDGSFVTIPSSLVLPTKPSSIPRVNAQLGELARRIMALGEPYRRR